MVELLKDLSTDFSNSDIPLRQVIVNTHSPILVQEINQWKKNIFVSLQFAIMRTRTIDMDAHHKQLVKVTTVLPVAKERQLSLDFSEQDKKISIQTVTDYLKTLKGEGE